MLPALFVALLLVLSTASANASRPATRSRQYQRRATVFTPAGWTSLGCVVDSSSARVLTGYSSSSSKMTVPLCLNACATKGFAYGGLQYGSECYCGAKPTSTIDAGTAACSVPCAGDTSQLCGATWRLNLYQTTASQTPTYKFIGCVTDGEARALPAFSTVDTVGMTVAKCQALCTSKGFVLAGVQYGTECHCDNSIKNGLGIAVPVSECSARCPGDGSTTNCGGTWRLSLFSSSSTPISVSSSSSSTQATSSTPAPVSTVAPAGWKYVNCVADSNTRALTGNHYWDSKMTISKCLTWCGNKQFALGGVENGEECWCGNALTVGQGRDLADSMCNVACVGDATQTSCGGNWKISLWSTLSGSALSSAVNKASTTTVTTTSTPVATTTTSTPVTTTTAAPPVVTAPSSTSFTPTTPAIAGSGNTKFVWAHHIVGNTYPYNYDSWMADIRLASANGIDGFALNIGPDTWQPDRVALAYQAAAESGTGFKMFISFDMTAFSCGDSSRLGLFRDYIDKYQNHAAQARFNGKSIVTTFSGSDCSFGQGSTNNGWSAVLGGYKNSIYFMPAYTSAPTGLNQYEFQAEKNWGSAWPTGAANIETSRDQYFMTQLGGRGYVGTISPLFAAQFSYKNFIWRGDEWLFSQRWEQVLGMRNQMDQVEVVSWNDYGESTYVGPITGDMPSDARRWANSNFEHQDILSLNAFYSTAWKTGKYPTITADKVWVMARPHTVWANAQGGIGPPDGREYSKDNFYAQVHLTSKATVILSTNAGSQQFDGQPGINRFQYPLSVGSGIRVQVVRNGATTVNLAPSFTFINNPATYNFNYFIKSS